MRYRLMEFIRCPHCLGNLLLNKILEEKTPDVIEGKFPKCDICSFEISNYYPHQNTEKKCALCWKVNIVSGELECKNCKKIFNITNNIPRMAKSIISETQGELRKIKENTSKSFGFEWKFYNRYGWDNHGSNNISEKTQIKQIEKEAFFIKAIAKTDEFNNKLVLDAGCGNGRYCYQAHQQGSEVIGVDLSEAVESAAKNLYSYPNVHIIQSDLFKLALSKEIFDRIFSIGVLMHTGNARQAFESILRHLKPGGVVSIHVYKKGNFIYECNDALIRNYTTKMNHRKLIMYSKIGAIIGKLLISFKYLTFGKSIIYPLFNCFIRLEAKEHKIFDWYSAPIATHHNYDEVFNWFKRNELNIIGSRRRDKNILLRLLNSPAAGVTIKGKRED